MYEWNVMDMNYLNIELTYQRIVILYARVPLNIYVLESDIWVVLKRNTLMKGSSSSLKNQKRSKQHLHSNFMTGNPSPLANALKYHHLNTISKLYIECKNDATVTTMLRRPTNLETCFSRRSGGRSSESNNRT
uniref:Uncharacterized protein n=1 Tax=Glossina austeni TaxID=7395 RepID=A0A1A9UEA8_GLOAU